MTPWVAIIASEQSRIVMHLSGCGQVALSAYFRSTVDEPQLERANVRSIFVEICLANRSHNGWKTRDPNDAFLHDLKSAEKDSVCFH